MLCNNRAASRWVWSGVGTPNACLAERGPAGRQRAERLHPPANLPPPTHPSDRPSGSAHRRRACPCGRRMRCLEFSALTSRTAPLCSIFPRSRTRKGRFEPGPLKGAREARRFSWLESEWERVVKRSGNRRKWMGRRGQKCALDWMCTRSCCDSLSVSGPRFETLVSV